MADPYSEPRQVADVNDCWFYHTVDAPGIGTVRGEWDLRPGIDAYLGHTDFRGKRVLDVGAASGFLSFQIERMGAEVVSYDISPDHVWDFVPYAGTDFRRVFADARAQIRKLNNGYWLCHRAFGSGARLAQGTAYAIPSSIGPVDAAVLGAILLHLRDPFLALQQALQLVTDTVVVVEALPRRNAWQIALGRWASPSLVFLPRFKEPQRHPVSWWSIPASTIQRFLEVLGFSHTRVTYHWQLFGTMRLPMYTVIGHRTHPAPILDEVPPSHRAAP